MLWPVTVLIKMYKIEDELFFYVKLATIPLPQGFSNDAVIKLARTEIVGCIARQVSVTI